MNRPAAVPIMALLVSAAASAAVDPALLKLVMPEAKVLYGIQVQQTLASPFGQFALSQVPANDFMTRFAATSGFELQRDLREVLAAGSIAADLSDGSDTLILARGNFAPDKFLALAGAIGARVSDYRGVSIIAAPQERNARLFAFLDPSTLAIGSEDTVRGVIDRRAGQIDFSGPLSQKAQDASADHDAWFATVTPLTDLIPSSHMAGFDPSALLQAVTESWVGVHFYSGGLTLAAEALTHSHSEAQGLAGMLKLVSGMFKGTPAAALQNAQVSASGAVMRVTLSVPEQDLERSFPAAAPHRAAR